MSSRVIDFFGHHIKPRKLRGTGSLNPENTGWITEGIAALRQKDVNFWIFTCGDKYIAFDSGYKNHPDAEKEILSLGINPDAVDFLFLTHGDMDHAGGLVSEKPLFKNAKVYLHKQEEDMLLGKEKRFHFGPIKLSNPINYQGKYHLLEDGEVLTIGDRTVEILHIPGHTPGHCGYLIDNRFFVSGDSMAFNKNGGYCFFSFYNMDNERNMASVKELRQRFKAKKPEMFLSGHSGCYKGDKPFAHADKVAKGTRKMPFDPDAPEDVFRR